MSVYTTELRYIIETWSTAPEGSTIDEIIDGAIPKIFNFTFPIWDPNYYSALEHKILQYYYFREIGFETAALWQMFLKRKLIEIMPGYVELHKSVVTEYNFLEPLNVLEEITRSSNEQGNSTTSNTSKSSTTTENSDSQESTGTSNNTRNVTGKNDNTTNGSNESFTLNSDLPQTTGVTPPLDYGTNSQKVNASNSNTNSITNTEKVTDDGGNTSKLTSNGTGNINNSANINGSNDYGNTRNETVKNYRHGNPGNKSYSELIQEFREAIINIDNMIIKDLEPLFMGLWGWEG